MCSRSTLIARCRFTRRLRKASWLAVARGELRPGERLPTVRQMAVDLRVNSNTVARVFAELDRQGVVETRRGLGTFVRETIAPAAERRAVSHHRLDRLCRAFIRSCSEEGFSLREVRRAIARLAKHKGDQS